MGEIQKVHYGKIDGLRAFSAIGIVLMHVLANGNYNVNNYVFDKIIPSFTNLVFLFMIVSAFGMCCGYYEKIVNNKITLDKFYGKRYAKVWPYFALLCVLDIIISPSKEALYEVFTNLTLCFGFLPDANISVIGVGWFLGLVFVFYIVFPFFCYLLSDKIRAWLSFGVALVLNILCIIYFDAGRTNFIYSAVFFFAGGLIYLYREQLGKIFEKRGWIVGLLCLSMTVLYYVMGASTILMIILFSLFLIYALGNNKKGILLNPVTKFISGISMEIYLCHMVIFRLIEKMGLVHLFKIDALSYIFVAIGTIVGAIVFSCIARKALEILGDIVKKVRKSDY